MNYHYYVVELSMPVITGTCTINGNGGYGTPLTCDQQTPVANQVYKFTDTSLVLEESDIFKCVKSVSETTPKLKAGNGVASRATATIQLEDFVGDPNPDSPAVLANQAILRQGTFFGKLKSRNIITNKSVVVRYYKRDDSGDQLVASRYYIATDLKNNGSGKWSLICKDVLYKADDTKSQYPPLTNVSLASDISDSATTINVNGDLTGWDATKHVAIVGDDILPITSVNSGSLTVARPTTYTLGSRTITNTPSDHKLGDEVFRGRKFVNADLFDVIYDVLTSSGIAGLQIDAAGMQAELNTWLASLNNSIDCIFYESKETTKVLDDICKTFLIDIWTDIELARVTLKANSPWVDSVATLTDGKEITYNTIKVDEPESLQYSRAFIQYDKRKLTASDDDVNFTRAALSINSEYEGYLYYGEDKTKQLPKSIILSNKLNNQESAELTARRYAQRFSYRPQSFKFEVEENNLSFGLGDVVTIVTPDNQGYDGDAETQKRAQITQITPKNKTGRVYQCEAITYNAFAGSVIGGDVTVTQAYDINLFTQAGGPTVADTYTFIFDGTTHGQNINAQTVAVGSFSTGSIIDIILVNDALITARGGSGGSGVDSDPNGLNGSVGTNGGTTFLGTSGVTVNIYLGGTIGSHTANGRFYASGGGGGGGDSSYTFIYPTNEFYGVGGGGGGAGAGFPSGSIGLGGAGEGGGADGEDGGVGTATTGGIGGLGGGSPNGGDGGDSGENGQDAELAGGLAGKALIKNGATVNIYTNGNTSRFKQGSGDAPTTIT